MQRFIFTASLIFFLLFAGIVSADTVGQKQKFYIESSYDLSKREEIRAVLVKTTPELYFYADEDWWNFTPQNEIYQALSDLGQEFENNIYSRVISVFGPEWNPGIDKDSKITVLIHPMKEEAGGYFSSRDEYSDYQISNSNQREMVYLNSDYIRTPLAKSCLAHEFVHLITFNQKENSHNITEKTWLNEARAEYVSTLLGYDDEYRGSNLEKKVEIFSNHPSDSLVGWQGRKEDYGVITLFAHYLVDHYGIEILVDSLHSSEIGIESINYALEKNEFEKDFSQIFLDFIIAVLINDCNYGEQYCFLNHNLRKFYIPAQTNFLPLSGKSTLTIVNTTKSWTGNWYKIIGGSGDLKLEFVSSFKDYFTVPYITKNRSNNYNINFIEIGENQKGEINIKDFGQDIISLYIIPVVNIDNNKTFYSFSWSVSVAENKEESELIDNLLAQIELLTAQIAQVQAQISAILNGERAVASANDENTGCSGCQQNNTVCREVKNNLKYGLTNNQEVSCLQQFLKSQGASIYPEGLVTGNFLSLTKSAVIRFQEKFASEILVPWKIEKGTGFVGRTTREMINSLLGY